MKIHCTRRTTPAMAAGAVNELWTVGLSPADSPRNAVPVPIVPELKER